MYVCICRGITEKQIRKAAAQQPFSAQELSSAMGVGSDCGTCMEHACRLLETIDSENISLKSNSHLA